MKGVPSYIKRVYKVFVAGMSYLTPYQYHFHSHYTAQQHHFQAQTRAQINKVYEFCAIDTVCEGNQHNVDKNITLEIFFDDMTISNVSFDLSKQRFVKADAKSLFRRKLQDKQGYIDYKFIGVETRIISKEEFSSAEDHRNKLFLRKKLDYKWLKGDNERLELQLAEKDRMIDSLSGRIAEIMEKNLELNRRIHQDSQKLKNPLNIKVNILSPKRHDNSLTAFEKMNMKIDAFSMESDLAEARRDCATLKERVAFLQVEKKKLEEKCFILVEGLKEEYMDEQEKQGLRRRIQQIDTLYLLKKSISHFEKSALMPHEKIQAIEEESEEEPHAGKSPQFAEFKRSLKIQNFKNSTQENRSKNQSKSAPKQEGERESILKRNKKYEYKEVASEEKMRSSGQFKANQQSLAKNQGLPNLNKVRSSVFFQNIKEAVSKDIALTQQDQKPLMPKVQSKEIGIQFFKNELVKKQASIDKLLAKEKSLQKLNMGLAEQKARMLMSSAINSIGSNSDDEIMAKIKQLSVYNTELLRLKQQLSEQLQELKQELNQRGKKLSEFEGVGRKSLIMLSQIGREKEIMESKFRGVLQEQIAKDQSVISQKKAQYQQLKEEFIQCQAQLKEHKLKLSASQQQLGTLQQQLKKKEAILQQIKQEKVELNVAVSKHQGERKQHELLAGKYDQIQRLQKGIKLFVLKMQSEYYKKMKNAGQDKSRAETKKLFREAFNRINQFQAGYFQVLLQSIKLIEESTEKYYQGTNHLYDGMAVSIEKKEQLWEKKAQIIKQREITMDLLKEKKLKIREKMNKRLILSEEEQNLILEGLKRLQNRLKQLQTCKINLKEANKNQKYAVPILYANTPENSMHSSLLSVTEVLKTGQTPAPMNTKNSGLMKSSVKSDAKFKQSNIMKIQEQQQEQDQAQKATFIKDSMVRGTGKVEPKLLSSSQRQEKRSEQDRSGNSKLSMLDIAKQSASKYSADKEMYKQSLIMSIAQQNEFNKERSTLREKEMESLKQLNEKMRRTQKEVYDERTEKERTILKYRQKEAQMEKQFKIFSQESQAKIQKANMEIDKVNNQISVMRLELEDRNVLVDRLASQIQETNDELLETAAERNDLKMQNGELSRMVADYEAAEQMMKLQVKQIHDNYVRHQAEMNQIVEQRSMQFMRIEKIRSVEIQKLKALILELEERNAEEVNQSLGLKAKVQDYKLELAQAQKNLEQMRQQSKLTIEKLQSELIHSRQITERLEIQIEVCQKDMMQLSGSLQAQEKEVMRLNLALDRYEKERNVYIGLQSALEERELNLKEDYKKYDYIVTEKNQKIRQWEENYVKLEERTSLLQLQAQSIRQKNLEMRQEVESAKQREFKREREVIQLQKEKSIEELKKQKLSILVEELDNDKKKLQALNQELTQKMEQLKKNISQLPSPRNRSQLAATNAGKGQPNPFALISVKSTKQLDSYQSLRYTNPKRQLSLQPISPKPRKQFDSYQSMSYTKFKRQPSPQANYQKSRAQQQGKVKQDSSDFLSNKSQRIMKQPKTIDPNAESITIEYGNRMNRKRPPELLEVKALKKSRLLNLPSMDVASLNPGQNSNLDIIQEHNDQMDDTQARQFHKHKLAQQLPQQEYYQVQLHEPKGMQQSAIEIEMMQSLHNLNRPNGQLQSGPNQHLGQSLQQSEPINDYDEKIYQEFQNYSLPQLVNQIVRSRVVIQQLTKKLEARSQEQQNQADSPFLNRLSEIKITNKGQKSAIQRSAKSINFGDIQVKLLQEEMQALKQKCSTQQRINSQNELFISEKELQISDLSKKIEKKQKDIEQLMQELQNVSQINCQLAAEKQKLQGLAMQLKSRLKEQLAQFSMKCQELVAESLKKDQALLQLNLAFQRETQLCHKLSEQLDQMQADKLRLQTSLANLSKKLQKSQKQYVKYEEQAELQILKLKEENDQLKINYNEKANQVVVMAEKYLQIEQQKKTITGYLKENDRTHKEKEKNVQKMAIEYQNAKNEAGLIDQQRKKILKDTRKLEQENLRLKQEIQNIHKSTNMQIQKFVIKSNQQSETIQGLKSKLRQKQAIVLQLKNEIALYNEETLQLKAGNQELSQQLLKAEKSLKEIMQSYEQEFKNINLARNSHQQKISQNTSTIKQKASELQLKNKEIKSVNSQIKALKEKNADLASKLQNTRIANSTKFRQLENEIAFKNDKINRLANEVSILQTKISQDKKQRQNKLQNSKTNELKRINEQLQASLIQLQHELQEKQKQLQKRPKIEQLNEIKYKATLLENSLKYQTYQNISQLNKNIEQDKKNLEHTRKQLQKANKVIIRQRDKANRTINQLKQIVEAFKQLESQNLSLRKELESQSRANATLKLQNRQLQKLAKQLQKQNDQLQKTHSVLHSKRSFSKLLTDVSSF